MWVIIFIDTLTVFTEFVNLVRLWGGKGWKVLLWYSFHPTISEYIKFV